MQKLALFTLLSAAFALSTAIAAPPAPAKPKLVLAIAVDQFRYDYLQRFRSEYTGGLNRLMTRGAVFPNAQYEAFPTVTAVGHSTFLTGAFPSVSGIIANDWYDRESGGNVTSVTDTSVKMLGGSGEGGSSPRRLLVSTVGDEMKISSNGKSRVIGISWKDRSAILPSGHMADGAFWVESMTGAFVSSTFYFADLPSWVKDLNSSKPAEKYLGAEWNLEPYGGAKMKMPTAVDARFINAVQTSPFGNEMLELAAERAIVAERLGKHEATDLLTLSLSSNDYVGHAMGPDSPEAHAISIHTDKLLDKLFRYLDGQIGMQNVLVVLTADHGVAPLPEKSIERKMPGGRLINKSVQNSVQKALEARFGKGKWILSSAENFLYFDRKLIQDKKLDSAEVQRVAAEGAMNTPHIARAYTREQLLSGNVMDDIISRRVMHGYNPQRGGDLVIVAEPYWLAGAKGTTHGTPYNYDTHVPVILMGTGIKAGRFNRQVAPNDIAPTLAAILGVEIPSGSNGRILEEILVTQ
ncbi:MAG: alkaline phosphatase family protein [Bryobacteraceae bacterium]